MYGKHSDTGTRLNGRATELARMLAFMRGKTLVIEEDVQIALRFVFSQIDPDRRRAIEHVIINHRATRASLARAIGRTVNVAERHINNLINIDILRRSPRPGDGLWSIQAKPLVDLMRYNPIPIPDPEKSIAIPRPEPLDSDSSGTANLVV
jgi:hypothetical protein